MSGKSLTIRRLPAGKPVEAIGRGHDAAVLSLELAVGEPAFPIGAAVEIDDGSMLYLGEVQQWTGSAARIFIEHSLDRTKLAGIRETWK